MELQMEDSTTLTINTTEGEECWLVEDTEPLLMQSQNERLDKEMDTTIWVHHNLIKLSKIIGVDFQGHEEEAMELLRQIEVADKQGRWSKNLKKLNLKELRN